MVNCTSAELKDFKTRYHVKECSKSTRIPKDDNLTLDEKFQKMALASRANFYLHKKHDDINQRLPFKGQLSELRYVPLKDITDGEQLDNIKSHLSKMERGLLSLIIQYERDEKRKEAKNDRTPRRSVT